MGLLDIVGSMLAGQQGQGGQGVWAAWVSCWGRVPREARPTC